MKADLPPTTIPMALKHLRDTLCQTIPLQVDVLFGRFKPEAKEPGVENAHFLRVLHELLLVEPDDRCDGSSI